MSMVPNWPELWEREPGLRPAEIMAPPTDAEQAAVDLAYTMTYEEAATEMGTTKERVRSLCRVADAKGILPSHAMAALCRDAAVRWLAKMSCSGTDLSMSMWTEAKMALIHGDNARLFAACKAVHDARKAVGT